MRIRCEELEDKSADTGSGMSPWVPIDELSDSVNIGEDDLHRFLSTDEESCNFDVDTSHLEMNAPEIQVFITTHQAPLTTSPKVPNDSNCSKVTSGFVSREVRPGRKGRKEGWRKQTAVLKAKCDVLRMEKEVARQRWEEGCADMVAAAQMAHSLRVAVESILEPDRRRESLSAPCTPRRQVSKEGQSHGLDERLRRLKANSAMRTKEMKMSSHVDLESQAEALHKRIELLQQRSQFPYTNPSSPEESDPETLQSDQQSVDQEHGADESDRCPLSASANDAVYRLLKEAEECCILEEELAKQKQTKETVREILAQINAEAEQWKQVQEVLKNVSVEMATVQQACLRWEKRALDAEHLATARQREREEWRAKAQTAQLKIIKLEAELTQLQETIEGVKQRHALEQSRWLDMGSGFGAPNNLGYTVILQPIANSSTPESCRCSVMKDQLEGSKRCADFCTSTKQNLQRSRVSEPSSLDRTVHAPSRLPSPHRPTSRPTCESPQVRQKFETASLHPARSTDGPKSSVAPRAVVSTSSRFERGRSISVDRVATRTPVRKPSPTRSTNVFIENAENLCAGVTVGSATTTTKKVLASRGVSPAKRCGQSPAPGCRGPSPPRSSFNAHQRGPLRDLKLNTTIR